MNTQVLMVTSLAISVATFVQQKTYFDENWQVTTTDKMVYYRETTKEGKLFHIKDFYKNGTLQMDGLSHNDSTNNEIFEGKIIWYNEDGSMEHYSHYKNGKLDGETATTSPNGDYARIFYKDDVVISGETLLHSTEYSFSHYEKIEGNKIHRIYFDKDIKGIRYEQNLISMT